MASYSYPTETTSTAQGVLGGAATGAGMGAAFGPVGMVIGAVGGGIYGGITQNKRNKAQKAAQDRLTEALNNRPKYVHQAELDENVKQAKGVQAIYEPLTKTNLLPGQAYMQNRVDSNASNAIAKAGMEGLTSPSQYAQLLAATTQSQNDATTNLGIAGAQNRQANIANYFDATRNVADNNTALANAKDIEFDTNIQQPWLSSVNMARDTFNDSVSRNRTKSDQLEAMGLQGLSQVAGGIGKGGKGAGKGKTGLNSGGYSPEMLMQLQQSQGGYNSSMGA